MKLGCDAQHDKVDTVHALIKCIHKVSLVYMYMYMCMYFRFISISKQKKSSVHGSSGT